MVDELQTHPRHKTKGRLLVLTPNICPFPFIFNILKVVKKTYSCPETDKGIEPSVVIEIIVCYHHDIF